MNFLNEIVDHYPDAISLAPGRPVEETFEVARTLQGIDGYLRDRSAGGSGARELDRLGQYGRTNGIIREAIARHLEVDEAIGVDADAIVVTVGCQEAMLVLLLALFEPEEDVLLVTCPTYIGITGLADLLGIRVHPLRQGAEGLEPDVLRRGIAEVRATGRRPRALYDIPDFNNPRGSSMPLPARKEILRIAQDEELLIFEDNPYGMFSYDAPPAPTLKSLDSREQVIYLGSFSKTLFPGLRVGYIVADQVVEEPGGGALPLAQALSRVKSLTTVNTPPLMQAAVAGVLARHGHSLEPRVREILPVYRERRDAMLGALERSFGADELLQSVSWSRPRGGFFVSVKFPFEFGRDAARECAADFGVICCPMTFFTVGAGCEDEARLSFSYATPEQIEEGVGRLARYAERVVRG